MSVNSHSRRSADARKQPVQERSRRTVDRILDAAARIFSERGYSATTTNHVAEAAGISIGSLYQYFPNKDALLVALEERHLDVARAAVRDRISRWRADRPDPERWAHELVAALVDVNDSPLHVVIYDEAPPLPHIASATAELVDLLVTDTASHLRRWGRRRQTRLRARILVVTALRLVHDIVIRAPVGAARTRAEAEVARLLTASIADER